jgi:hypothetical protein
MKDSFRLGVDERRWITTVFGDAFVAENTLSDRDWQIDQGFKFNSASNKRGFGVDDVS